MSSSGKNELGSHALHLWALCAFAIAQPLFDVVQRDAEFFVAHRSQPLDLVLLALGLIVVPPLLLVAPQALLGRWRRALQYATVGTLIAVIVLAPLQRASSVGAVWLLLAAASAGSAGAVAYARWKPLSTVLTVLAPAPVLFAALFLFYSPVSKLVIGRGEGLVPASAVESDTSVVLVIFDELPLTSLMNTDLEIDAGLFPNFARFAGHSTWFRNATANHGSTTFVIPSILTGRLPSGPDLLPIASDHPQTLFTMLGASYRMRVRETVTSLCPPHLGDDIMLEEGLVRRVGAMVADLTVVYGHIVLPSEYAAHLPTVNNNWRIRRFRRAKSPTAQGPVLRKYIDRIDASDEPTLYFLHIVLPHVPWIYLPSGAEYDAITDIPGQSRHGVWGADESPTELALQRHLLQLGYADVLLGELLDRLESTGVYDRSLVVVMADHGASFFPGTSRREAAGGNPQDIMLAPLFVKEPGQREARVSDRNVESIDILPTIAGALEIELPWEVDGVSALDTEQPAREEKVIYSRDGALAQPAALPTSWPALERRERLFGRSPSWEDVYASGPHRELIGQPTSELDVRAAAELQAHVYGRERFLSVDEQGLVPCFIEGEIEASSPPLPTEVAIAINGVVRAVTTTFDRAERRALFAAIVADTVFRQGRNTVEAFAVDGNGSLTSMSTVTYSLSRDDDGMHILASDGRDFRIAAASVEGEVDLALEEKGHLRLRGWALGRKQRTVADTVLVLDRDRVVFSGPTGFRRKGLSQRLGVGSKYDYSGFWFHLPLSLFDGKAAGRVRVFALCGDVASELRWTPEAKWASVH